MYGAHYESAKSYNISGLRYEGFNSIEFFSFSSTQDLRQQLIFAQTDKEKLQQSLSLTEEQQTTLNNKLEVCDVSVFRTCEKVTHLHARSPPFCSPAIISPLSLFQLFVSTKTFYFHLLLPEPNLTAIYLALSYLRINQVCVTIQMKAFEQNFHVVMFFNAVQGGSNI